jgi:hypothetical protein
LPFGLHLPRKNKVEEVEDMATPQYANTATNQIMSPGDRSDRREKGIDIDMIDASEVIRKLEWLSSHEEEKLEDVTVTDNLGNVVVDQVPALDSFGNPIYSDEPITTPQGIVLIQHKIVLVNKPRMAKQLVRYTVNRPWADACLVLVNKIWHTLWMSCSVANNKKLHFRTLFYGIREKMPYRDTIDWGNFVDTVEALATSSLEDCKDGHKPLLLKVDTHRLEVSTNRSLASNKSG